MGTIDANVAIILQRLLAEKTMERPLLEDLVAHVARGTGSDLGQMGSFIQVANEKLEFLGYCLVSSRCPFGRIYSLRDFHADLTSSGNGTPRRYHAEPCVPTPLLRGKFAPVEISILLG
ncbi:hypothetical protein BdWA1_001543 [Babesia duncani]|uniref:Uncharacterized protein n=1 Tax=Babesia duncani TaxID=323732 RepID=A0AAD9UNV6_9APIC|nr:hypothetical protein BdWA1_001543 [Babesia duncani]